MDQDTIFTKIINREIPAMIAYEDEDHTAFADVNPRADGHLLVVPKKVYKWFLDMPKDEYIDLMLLSKTLGARLASVTGAESVYLKIVGTDVPHVHVHLIPINTGDDLSSEKQLDEQKTKEIIAKFKQKD